MLSILITLSPTHRGLRAERVLPYVAGLIGLNISVNLIWDANEIIIPIIWLFGINNVNIPYSNTFFG